MIGPKPAFRPRPGGGFNPGFGQMNEHLDESAVQAASQQKALQQTAGSVSANPPSGPGAAAPGGLPAGPSSEPVKPRAMGSIPEELVVRPAKDIVKGLASLFDLNAWLGIPKQVDDPQTQARKQQMLQRFNRLTDEQQAEAKRRYDLNLKKKQQAEQEKQAREQQQRQQEAQSLEMPSSPQKGPVGPGSSKKQKAANKLQQDRKTLSGPSSVG